MSYFRRSKIIPSPQTVKKTVSQVILEGLGSENRRVLSDWRAFLLWQKATEVIPQKERRWNNAPLNIESVYPILRNMQKKGEIKPIVGLRHIYEVVIPYSILGPIGEDEVLMEAHPYAALGYLSALVFHGITVQMPKSMTMIAPKQTTGSFIPIGTDSEDWIGIEKPLAQWPRRVLGTDIEWKKLSAKRLFGIREYKPRGYPVRATTLERTLLDGLEEPEKCGGMANVLRAWALAADVLDLDALVNNVEQYSIGVLRQRVGFILDELKISHPEVERWRIDARRGGSSRLLSSAPYAPNFSERWSLSINSSITALHEDLA